MSADIIASMLLAYSTLATSNAKRKVDLFTASLRFMNVQIFEKIGKYVQIVTKCASVQFYNVTKVMGSDQDQPLQEINKIVYSSFENRGSFVVFNGVYRVVPSHILDLLQVLDYILV